MQVHLKITRVYNAPRGTLSLSARTTPFGEELHPMQIGRMSKTAEDYWTISVLSHTATSVEIIARAKKAFKPIKEYGRLSIPLTLVKEGTVLLDWFPLRPISKTSKPMMLEIMIHLNNTSGTPFSPKPMTLKAQTNSIIPDICFIPKIEGHHASRTDSLMSPTSYINTETLRQESPYAEAVQ